MGFPHFSNLMFDMPEVFPVHNSEIFISTYNNALIHFSLELNHFGKYENRLCKLHPSDTEICLYHK